MRNCCHPISLYLLSWLIISLLLSFAVSKPPPLLPTCPAFIPFLSLSLFSCTVTKADQMLLIVGWWLRWRSVMISPTVRLFTTSILPFNCIRKLKRSLKAKCYAKIACIVFPFLSNDVKTLKINCDCGNMVTVTATYVWLWSWPIVW